MVNFHKQRAITPEVNVDIGLEKTLNNVTKSHKILIKSIRLSERTSFKMVNFRKQRAITPEGTV